MEETKKLPVAERVAKKKMIYGYDKDQEIIDEDHQFKRCWMLILVFRNKIFNA